MMDEQRKQELYRLVEICRHTDITDLEAEKTAAIEELLTENADLENEGDQLQMERNRAIQNGLIEVDEAEADNYMLRVRISELEEELGEWPSS